MAVQPTSATMPSAHVTTLRTNCGSSCRWLDSAPRHHPAKSSLKRLGISNFSQTSVRVGNPCSRFVPRGERDLLHLPKSFEVNGLCVRSVHDKAPLLQCYTGRSVSNSVRQASLNPRMRLTEPLFTISRNSRKLLSGSR
jgi:hypothetical protein